MTSLEHPLSRLWLRLERGEAVVAGVLSGTSADGIDVVLQRCGDAAPPATLAFATRPFPDPLARRLRALLDGEPVGVRAIALLTRDLGLAFGEAARALAAREGVDLDLVGSHGQTVWHHDGDEPSGPATLQLGDGDFVARAAGAVTVSDFRMADVALGGEGAPLAGLVDPELFPDLVRPAAILNLGGMANVTWLAAEGGTLAFDTGPANALLDGLARALLGRPFDADGRSAGAGQAHAGLVDALLEHPFLDRAPPRSTGRDTFGAAYVAGVLARARTLGLGAPDTLASATVFVARSIAEALERWLPARPAVLVLCGGGALNRTLAREIACASGLETHSSAAHGIDPEAREAHLFARLALRFVLGQPSTSPRVTGAGAGGILGKLSLPPMREGRITAAPRSQEGNPG